MPSRQEFEKHFNPRAYLDEYFTSLDDEDFFMARFLAQVLRPLPGQLLVHEFGGGPTLYSVAALCAKAREIHFSDAVSASLAEVQLWVDGKPEAFNWEPYIRLALEAEGAAATPLAIIFHVRIALSKTPCAWLRQNNTPSLAVLTCFKLLAGCRVH